MTTVIGLDLSLTSTGLALVEDGELTAWHCIKSKGKKDATIEQTAERIDRIEAEIFDTLVGWISTSAGVGRRLIHYPDLAVIEAPSFGSKGGSAHERGGLWWAVARELNARQIPMLKLAPTSRAKFITGNGRADKHDVLKLARQRWHMDIPNHDVADAAGLAQWGYDYLRGDAA